MSNEPYKQPGGESLTPNVVPKPEVLAGEAPPENQTPKLTLASAIDFVRGAISRYTSAKSSLSEAEGRTAEANARATENQANAEALNLKVIEAEHEANIAQGSIRTAEGNLNQANAKHQDALALLAEAQRLVNETAEKAAIAKQEYDSIFPQVAMRFVAVHQSRLEYEKFKTMATNEHLNAEQFMINAHKKIAKAKIEMIVAKANVLAFPQIAQSWAEVQPLIEEDSSLTRGGE